MLVYSTGISLLGTPFSFVGGVTVESPVSSITFSELNPQDLFVIDFYWISQITGIDRLDLVMNALPTPANSVMVRSQTEATLGGREDRKDPDFTLTDLVSVVAGSTSKGVLYFPGDIQHNLIGKRYAYSWGINHDSAVLLNDRIRTFQRQGMWNDPDTVATSFTIQTGSGRSSIAAGSVFQIFAR